MNIAAHTALPPVSAIAPGARRSWLHRFGRAAWLAMERTGRSRAQQALREYAYQCEGSNPELARLLRSAGQPDAR